ncbi:DUF2163 domain-containing protein [Parablastomonas sp. CN1-191]|uniref:DUF2163 domain-containing protein n=1 Tax=Parablastomonas sp. CN1-191 TaxID=3400908 RepID=UPI003BF91CCC
MSRVWFAGALDTAAMYWRVERRDGVTLGMTTHDRDLWFAGVCHYAAPGMLPSAIRRSDRLEEDSAEVTGALTDEAISEDDLALGRFDGARVTIGMVDWETAEAAPLYAGTLGGVSEEDGSFRAALQSRKAELDADPVPRTSPGCRAQFCGPGCTLSAARFTHEAVLTGGDGEECAIAIACPVPLASLVSGTVRWLDGVYAGIAMGIAGLAGTDQLALDTPLDRGLDIGARLLVREGCDRTLETCADRFANAVNFRGEPFLPGNDLVARYPAPGQ